LREHRVTQLCATHGILRDRRVERNEPADVPDRKRQQVDVSQTGDAGGVR
jgi:hypothetical protein